MLPLVNESATEESTAFETQNRSANFFPKPLRGNGSRDVSNNVAKEDGREYHDAVYGRSEIIALHST